MQRSTPKTLPIVTLCSAAAAHLSLVTCSCLLVCGTHRYRLRQSFDSPRPLHVRPGDPEFEGRLTSEINSVYGPR